MWSVTENYLPHFKGRGVMTKVNAMITTIDDVYDVYGTLPELEQFTNAMNRLVLLCIVILLVPQVKFIFFVSNFLIIACFD